VPKTSTFPYYCTPRNGIFVLFLHGFCHRRLRRSTSHLHFPLFLYVFYDIIASRGRKSHVIYTFFEKRHAKKHTRTTVFEAAWGQKHVKMHTKRFPGRGPKTEAMLYASVSPSAAERRFYIIVYVLYAFLRVFATRQNHAACRQNIHLKESRGDPPVFGTFAW